MADRRRVNGPPSGTLAPIFATQAGTQKRPTRSRGPNELRKIFLKTGVTPSSSGSAYLEIQSPTPPTPSTRFTPQSSSLKISCTVHGPKPLPRSAPFSPHLVLTAHVKYASFATKQRRGYLRDNVERDIASHLETALRGAVLGERWPKCGADVVVTILEAEDDAGGEDESGRTRKGGGQWGTMNALAGCITVSSAALIDAGIDCVDVVTGGVAAVTQSSSSTAIKGKGDDSSQSQIILDPSPSEHADITAACVVGYLPNRDEITELWLTSGAGTQSQELIDSAVEASNAMAGVLNNALLEAAQQSGVDSSATQDVGMTG